MFKLKIVENQLITTSSNSTQVVEITDNQKLLINELILQTKNFESKEFQNKLDSIIIQSNKDKKSFNLNNEKFFRRQEKVYLRDYNIEVPDAFIKAFNGDLSEGYVNFLKLLSLNPIQEIREKFPTYVINNKLRVTDNGYVVACRQVQKINSDEKGEVYDKIKSLYFKVKTKWKKSPSKTLLNKDYNITTNMKDSVLTLQEAYTEYQDYIPTNTYCSHYNWAYNREAMESWTVGCVMDLGKRSLTNTELSCGSDMLHVRSNPNELSGFGDTNIMVIINPQDVISCVTPWKFGVYKCYFASIMEDDDKDLFNLPLQDFEHDYMELEWEILENKLKEKSSQYTFAGEEISINKEDYKKIIQERRVLLNK